MEFFLHASPNDHGKDLLKEQFSASPSEATEALSARARLAISACCSDATLQEARQSATKQIDGMIRATQDFEKELPQKQSIFRGGEDSLRAYPAFCKLVQSLASHRDSLRESALALAQLHDRLMADLASLYRIRAEVAVARRLELPREILQAIATLDSPLEEAVLHTRVAIDTAKAALKQARSVDQILLFRFIELASRKADVRGEGRNCDRSAVSSLVAGLRRELESRTF